MVVAFLTLLHFGTWFNYRKLFTKNISVKSLVLNPSWQGFSWQILTEHDPNQLDIRLDDPISIKINLQLIIQVAYHWSKTISFMWNTQ